MEDNDMRLSCKGWLVISHLWRWELLQTATVRLGIDTLIANILVPNRLVDDSHCSYVARTRLASFNQVKAAAESQF